MSPVDPAAPATAETFRLEADGEGRLAARGPLTFATARQARQLGIRALGGGSGRIEIDCSGIATADSAGLAVLLDWLAVARAGGRGLGFKGLPEGLMALARISEVDELLARGI